MKAQRICLLAVSLLFGMLTGCASKSIRSDFLFKSERSEGIVVISVSHDLSGGRGAKAIFFLDGGVMSGKGSMFFSLPDAVPGIPGASAFEDSYGHVLALALPVGRHKIDSWQIINGTGLRIFPKEKPTPLVFEVGAGEIKYLGNLHANLQTGKNIFGMTIVGNGYAEVRDQRERDIPMFEDKYPQFKGKIVAELLGLGPW